ncbi:MAG: carbon-nitrogen hydrolase [bacterium]|nr:carbon-nitrogen hydrolase [bacterium]
MKYKIALIQTKPLENKVDNLYRAGSFLKKAASNGANIICLPELFLTPYFCQKENQSAFRLAESIPGPATDKLQEFSRELGVVIIASLFEKRTKGIFHNTTTVIDADGSLSGFYRKMHIPDDPGFYEKYYFTPGDQGYRVFDTRYGRIGVLICWDQWFPEAARMIALQGADIIFYPTAIGWLPSEKTEYGEKQLDAWITVQRSHAIANGLYTAAVNRAGYEKPYPDEEGIEFWGNSFISDPYGCVFGRAGSNEEEIVYADIQTAVIEDVRQTWPFFRDRRIDSYDGLLRKFID